MSSIHQTRKFLTIFAIGVGIVSPNAPAKGETLAAFKLKEAEPILQAGIGAEPVGTLELVPILALSVAAITLVRRRVRH